MNEPRNCPTCKTSLQEIGRYSGCDDEECECAIFYVCDKCKKEYVIDLSDLKNNWGEEVIHLEWPKGNTYEKRR